jgi:beta-N-acetylhexosaminidase
MNITKRQNKKNVSLSLPVRQTGLSKYEYCERAAFDRLRLTVNLISKIVVHRGMFFLILLTPMLAACQQKPDKELDKMIGQMILIGFPKPEVDSLTLAEVKVGKAGAIIYFEKNLPPKNTVAAVKKMNETYQKAAPIPLLICIDQEGGKVNRMKTKYGFPKSVTAAYLGKTKSLDSARMYAASTAKAMKNVGFNVNFAPCVDLAINKENTVIVKVERSYSRNADTVAMFATEIVKEHRKQNIITALKHFPGHGSSLADTHYGAADVTNTWLADEIKPYKTMLANGHVDAIMSSHIANKKLDPKGLPGTLSKQIVDSLLRKKLGYTGVVFSDDMQMKAVAGNFSRNEMIKLAINAGVDILCFSNNVPPAEQVTVTELHSIIKGLIASGEIRRERIEESYKRIMELKKKLK